MRSQELWLAAGLVCGACGAAAADGWTSTHSAGEDGRADKAGYSAANNFETIWFSCEGAASGFISLIFTGFDNSLQPGLDYTVVVSVEGTAYLQTTRAVVNEMDGGKDLVRTAPLGAFTALIEALKAGSRAEISSPAGRSTVSLSGSSKALAALTKGCA